MRCMCRVCVMCVEEFVVCAMCVSCEFVSVSVASVCSPVCVCVCVCECYE